MKKPQNKTSEIRIRHNKTSELARTDPAYGVKRTHSELAKLSLEEQVGHSHLDNVWEEVCKAYPKLLKKACPDDDRFRAVDYWFYPYGVKVAIAITSNPLELYKRVRKVSLGMSAYSSFEVPKRVFIVMKASSTVEDVEKVLMQVAQETPRPQLVTLNYCKPQGDSPFTRKILNSYEV